MSLANVDGIRSREMVGLLIDFLTESRAGLVSLRSPRRMKAINDSRRTRFNVPKRMRSAASYCLRTQAALTEWVGRFDGAVP